MSTRPADHDPKVHFDELRSSAARALLRAIRYLPLFFYFSMYWNRKDSARRAVVTGALWFFSISVVMQFLEVVLELTHKSLAELIPENNLTFKAVFLLLFAFATLAFLTHHSHERHHTRTEHSVTRYIWSLLQSRDTSFTRDSFIAFVLSGIVFRAFVRSGATRVWLWEEQDGKLRVLPGRVYPDSSDSHFVRELEVDQGIAGLVYSDSIIRYVPRTFFPLNRPGFGILSMPFPHAVAFPSTYAVEAQSFDLGPPQVFEDQMILNESTIPRNLRSFVSVPLRVHSTGTSLGVLCIDFSRTDPLGRDELKMAAVFGAIFGEELERRFA